MDRWTLRFDKARTRLPCNAKVSVSLTTPALVLLVQLASWLRRMSVSVMNRREMGQLHKLSISLLPNDGFRIERAVDLNDAPIEIRPNTVITFRLLSEKWSEPTADPDDDVETIEWEMFYLELVDPDDSPFVYSSLIYRAAVPFSEIKRLVDEDIGRLPEEEIARAKENIEDLIQRAIHKAKQNDSDCEDPFLGTQVSTEDDTYGE